MHHNIHFILNIVIMTLKKNSADMEAVIKNTIAMDTNGFPRCRRVQNQYLHRQYLEEGTKIDCMFYLSL